MPEFRRRLSMLKVELNEKKFYFQHYSKGIMCLGTMLKFGRRYIKNKSFYIAMRKIDLLSVNKDGIKRVLCSINSHLGMFKNIEQKRRMKEFVKKALNKFRKLYWNSKKSAFNIMEVAHG